MARAFSLSFLLLIVGLAPARAADLALVVHELADLVSAEYFDAEVAQQASQSLRNSLAAGRYADAQTPAAVAERLTAELLSVTKDKHLVVAVTKPAPAREDESKRRNFGVQRVEVLAGNVGYLNLTAFDRPEEANEAISAAMQVLRNADALILDLRENFGGSLRYGRLGGELPVRWP